MRRVILVLAFVTIILESAWVILGPPDVKDAIAFFDSGIPTLVAGQAVMVLIAWLAIVAAVGGLVLSVSHTIGRSQLAQHPTARAGILLAAGLLLLVVSVVQHSLTSTSLCCESSSAAVREAIHLAE
jgi:hypothetical protein